MNSLDGPDLKSELRQYRDASIKGKWNTIDYGKRLT
jgi:hypothetical protein